jgi:hypothetical protein
MPNVNPPPAQPTAAEAGASWCRAWVRHVPRQKTPCQLVALADKERWPARVHDLSTGGVGLHMDRRVEVGRFVLVELLSASGLFSRLLLTRVVHLSEHAEGGFLLGGEFISELPERELRFLLA